MDQRSAALVAAILVIVPSAALAADIERNRTKQMRGTLEQEIVKLTANIEKARESGQITRNQSLSLKRHEEDFIKRIDDLQDDDRGNVKPRNAKLIARKLSSLNNELSTMQQKH